MPTSALTFMLKTKAQFTRCLLKKLDHLSLFPRPRLDDYSLIENLDSWYHCYIATNKRANQIHGIGM